MSRGGMSDMAPIRVEGTSNRSGNVTTYRMSRAPLRARTFTSSWARTEVRRRSHSASLWLLDWRSF